MKINKLILKMVCAILVIFYPFSLNAQRGSKDKPASDIYTNITIPTADISGVSVQDDVDRHVIIASGAGEDGWHHPHTLLMPDGKTMFAAWTAGHGGKAGPIKRSDDGGLTWSEPIKVPENWATVEDCPTIHRLVDPKGVARLFVFTGKDTLHQSISEDQGKTWSPMRPNGWFGIVAPMNVLAVEGGKKYLSWNHTRKGRILQSASTDGGLTWSQQTQPIDMSDYPDAFMCEPAVIRSPDRKQLLMLIRENTHCHNSLFVTSDDEGKTWSKVRELPVALTGDRHAPAYAKDGRLIVAMREIRPAQKGVYTIRSGGRWKCNMYMGHPTAWVGRYEDIVEGREGEYRIKLFHQFGDNGYHSVQSLPDGTIVVTTYLPYRLEEKTSIVATRFKLDDIERRLHFANRKKR